jgi:hypothetical protein
MRLALVIASAALFAGAEPAAASNDSARDDGDAALWSRLDRIETAFRGGDATSLRLSCSERGKVRVDLKDLTGQASYGPGQLQVVFGQIFEDYETQEFAFRRGDVSISTLGTAFARGRWVRRRSHGGRDTVETLTFTLREESGDWRIHEVRSSR